MTENTELALTGSVIAAVGTFTLAYSRWPDATTDALDSVINRGGPIALAGAGMFFIGVFGAFLLFLTRALSTEDVDEELTTPPWEQEE